MRVTATPLPGVLLIEPQSFRDDRGFFLEAWQRRRYAEQGIDVDFVQDNHSRSAGGVLRGLHLQDATAPMGKLVRCTVGAIFDVAADLRVGEPTFGKWYGVELSADNMLQLWVPAGFAHGFATLSEVAETQYKCTSYYAPEAEYAIRWDDPELAISWPVAAPVLSARDRNGMSLAEYRKRPAFPAGSGC